MTQQTSLPASLTPLLSGINTPSAPLFATPFLSTATLIDEGQPKNGRAAIEAWAQSALIDRHCEAKLVNYYPGREEEGEEQTKRTVYLEVQLQGDYEKDYGIVGWFTLWWEVRLVTVEEGKEMVEHLVMTPKDPREEK